MTYLETMLKANTMYMYNNCDYIKQCIKDIIIFILRCGYI